MKGLACPRAGPAVPAGEGRANPDDGEEGVEIDDLAVPELSLDLGVGTGPAGRPVEILLVEDNPSDVVLTRHLLAGLPLPVHVSVAYDGEEAMVAVRGRVEANGGLGPDLVLLDLNLPRKSGLDVLEELKADTRLRHIPVIVLTTSTAERDVQSAYERHANAYVTKPVDLDQFVGIIRAIEGFWFSVVRLPGTTHRY